MPAGEEDKKAPAKEVTKASTGENKRGSGEGGNPYCAEWNNKPYLDADRFGCAIM